ncbi:MAG TPA: carboxypeptidase-like regulatory domain-containing protein [Candidatus Thermoplasmatota archaeon]|nr:carboxypeptidase-like regulatory domain-containing protein [Candidatus Thermoplasmatota archaeon]
MRPGLACPLAVALLLAGCAHAPGPEASQTTTDLLASRLDIHGVVVDEGLRPLSANVTLVETNETQATEDGVFRFDDLAPGVHGLRVSSFGFRTQLLTVSPEMAADEVRIVLEALPGLVPYNQTLHFHGFMECALEALIITPSCDTLLTDPRVGGPMIFPSNTSAVFPVQNAWRTVLADLVFDPDASPALQGLHVTVRGGQDDDALASYEQYGRFDGSAPFQFRIEPGQTYRDGTSAVPANTTVFVMDVYPEGLGYGEVCDPSETFNCFLGVGAGQNIEFDLYVTTFYVDPAPQDFKFV